MNDLNDRRNAIQKYYDDLVDKYGYGHRACDYGRKESQLTKFRVLAEAADYSNKKVLDVGCGFADFAAYIQSKYEKVDYVGIDLSLKMVQQARKLRPDLRIEHGDFFSSPPLGQFDIIVANGIFYLLGDDAFNTMQRYVRMMFQQAREGVFFNSLSLLASDRVEGEFYADPSKTLRFCLEMTPWVILRHDYHPRDFTVYLYKR